MVWTFPDEAFFQMRLCLMTRCRRTALTYMEACEHEDYHLGAEYSVRSRLDWNKYYEQA
jgi:hypothetical protein